MTVTVWEKLSESDEAAQREFEAPEDLENAREYCAWANSNAGREVFFTSNPDEE